MKISYNWLKDFVHFTLSPKELADLFDNLGLAVDGLDRAGGDWSGVVIGKVISCKRIPDTDHLSFCDADIGSGELLPVVCGAPNVAEGQTIAFAPVGSVLKGGFKIEKRKIRGVLSRGMICSEAELGVSKSHEGIFVLSTSGDLDEHLFELGKPLEDYYGREDWIFHLFSGS